MSANSTEATSYLSAMTPRSGSLSRSAMLAGSMLVSSASERSYWASISASARAVSRSANHIVTTTITTLEMVVTTKPVDWAQAGGDGGQRRSQHDVFDPQQQHHQACPDQEEELRARTSAHVPGAGDDRDVGGADKRKRRNQFAESLQPRNDREDHRAGDVY